MFAGCREMPSTQLQRRFVRGLRHIGFAETRLTSANTEVGCRLNRRPQDIAECSNTLRWFQAVIVREGMGPNLLRLT